MKKFLFLSYGYQKPTPKIMKAWGRWFASIADKIVAQEGLGTGRAITPAGTKKLSRDMGAATGYIIFKAKNLKEAESIAKGCPVIASNVVQEIMPVGHC
ncbi:MAG: hypothetical protein HY302_12030 [Opitutae bacterium]|nr:hypothetical protein [Opitutae bacterium]